MTRPEKAALLVKLKGFNSRQKARIRKRKMYRKATQRKALKMKVAA